MPRTTTRKAARSLDCSRVPIIIFENDITNPQTSGCVGHALCMDQLTVIGDVVSRAVAEEVAEMVGWTTEDVDRVAKRYADAERIALAWLERIKRRA